MNIKELTAPCGIDCFNCHVHEENITEETKQQLASVFKREPEDIPCKGCRVGGCTFYPEPCATLTCVNEKGYDFCYECNEFPCEKYSPSVSGADKYPHNLKVFNLCRIQKVGLEEWAKEAKLIREKYFEGTFILGSGPVLKK